MKKVLITLALVFTIALSGVGVVQAQQPMENCNIVRTMKYDGTTYTEGTTVDVDQNEGAGAVVCLINTVNRAAQVLFYIMMGLVVGLVILGGFFILTSGGSEDQVSQGKQYITYAIFGVVIGVFAYAVPALLNFIMG